MLSNEKLFQGSYSTEIKETIFLLIRPYRLKIAGLILLAFISRLALLYISNIFGYWADSLCVAGNHCRPIPHFFQNFKTKDYLLLLSSLVGSSFFLVSFFRIYLARIGVDWVGNFYKEVTYVVSRLPLKFFDQTEVGKIVTRFSVDFASIFRMGGGPTAEFISLIIDLVVITVLLCLTSPFFLIFEVLTIVINYQIYKINRDWYRKERRLFSRIKGPTIGHFSETIYGRQVVNIYNRQEKFFRKFYLLMKKVTWYKLRTFIFSQFFTYQLLIISSLMIFISALFGPFLLKMNLISLGDLGVGITFIMMLSTTIQLLFDWLANMEDAMTGVERIDEYLRTPIDKAEKLPTSSLFHFSRKQMMKEEEKKIEARNLSKIQGVKLKICNLKLMYSKNMPLVLKGINLEILPYEHVGIIGKTGHGKTSLIQSLFYLYPFLSGRVLVDNYTPDVFYGDENDSHSHLNFISTELFRQFFSIITQGPVLFRETLRFNLVGHISKSSIDDQKIFSVMKSLGLDQWFSLDEVGLNFQIEEGGRNLSAGQKQFISLARCLLNESPIVIMDEATSDVDPESETLLYQKISTFLQSKTVIVVAHRMETMQRMNRLIWIHEGQVKEDGKPQVVLSRFLEEGISL